MHLFTRLGALLRRKKLDAEMSEEMRLHLEQRARENVAGGMTPEEARYAALRKFGGVEQAKERAREQRPGVWLEQCGQDLRYAARQLRRSPGFATTIVAIVALGIGATTTIFSVVNGMLLKPLPYAEPGRLVHVFEAPKPGEENNVSTGVFGDWREHSTVFEGLAAYRGVVLNVAGAGEPERIAGVRMTAGALQVLRAQPVLGRVFAAGEDQPGSEKVVVLTYQLWQRRFGGEASALGRTVLLNDEPYTIIGVLPAGFLPFEAQEFVIPFVFPADWRDRRDSHGMRVIGRLRPDVSLAQARAELATIVERSRSLYPSWKKDWGVTILPYQETLVNDIRPALLVLLGAVALVLLVACANVANLLLAKAASRGREIAVRVALGASRARIVRQLLAESLLLSCGGAAAGLLLAVWLVDALQPVLGEMNLARAHEVALDPFVAGCALAVSLVTGIAFGLVPALHASRPDLNHALKDAARGSSSGGSRLRGALIIGEVAVALMLLVGAGLVLHSFARLIRVPAGFAPERAVTMQLSLSAKRYADNARLMPFFQEVAERVAALPGVEAAGLSAALPLHGSPDRFFRVIGRASQPEPGYDLDFDFCTPGYFSALGVPLRRGRMFTVSEALANARVAVVNETLARELFPHEDPIGQRLGYNDQTWEIIGVVGDVRMRSLARKVNPMVYRPQSADGWRNATLVVRTHGAPLASVESVRRALRELDPLLPIANVATLEQIVGDSVSERRLTLVLLGAFAAGALLLAAIGLYGVVAFGVAQRTREFGIRAALGADRGALLRLVLRQGLKLVFAGLALGLLGALSLSHLLTTLLYEVAPTDPATFAGVSLLLLAVAVAASWLPARHAAKVDPMTALRAE